MSASSWASAVSSPGSSLESPTGPRGAREQSSSSAWSARSPPARCARRSIRRRAVPSRGARGHPGSWRSRSSTPFDGASTRREPVCVLKRRQTRARQGVNGAQPRGHRAATASALPVEGIAEATFRSPARSLARVLHPRGVVFRCSNPFPYARTTRFVRPGRGRGLEGLRCYLLFILIDPWPTPSSLPSGSRKPTALTSTRSKISWDSPRPT